jgi:ABC-type dipeptide/oligopeptide/nickel transport system ATPase component
MSAETQAKTAASAAAETILTVNNIEVIYDHVILVLKGVSLDVPKGGIVALLGANGAGKTTTLKAISNLLHAERGEVTKGSIMFDAAEVHDLTPNELVRRGCIQVMEGRQCFAHPRRKHGDQAGSRPGLLLFSQAERAKAVVGGLHLGGRTADVRDRPRADVTPEDDIARRTIDGACAANR